VADGATKSRPQKVLSGMNRHQHRNWSSCRLAQAVSGFTDEERAALLRFVTSVPRPPLLGFKYLEPQLCIQARAGCRPYLCNACGRASLRFKHAAVNRLHTSGPTWSGPTANLLLFSCCPNRTGDAS